MVLVTALLLVGLFGASVLAQSNAGPSIKSLDDTEIRLTGAAYTVNLTEEVTDTTIKVDGTAQFDGAAIT